MQDFRQLKVWTKAYELALEVYRATQVFPAGERFGLTSQLRRAAVSIPSNIAEGSGRPGDGEMLRFLGIAMGSASEVECQLLLASDLGFLASNDTNNLLMRIGEIRRMLNALMSRISADRRKPIANSQ